VTALLEVGAGVGWPDIDAAAVARRTPTRPGRFAELVEWLAGVQGRFPPERPDRVRAFVLGPLGRPVAELAERYDVGLRSGDLDADATKAFAQGVDAADREIDEGADLLVLAARDDTSAPNVLISVLTDAEPVALLPRGAEAVDSERWVAAAEELRDGRREVAELRSRPDELLAALGSPLIAASAGFALRAAARRTAVVLDGNAVLAAHFSASTATRAPASGGSSPTARPIARPPACVTGSSDNRCSRCRPATGTGRPGCSPSRSCARP